MTLPARTDRVVGVTQRVDKISGRNETRDALDQNLVAWLCLAGFLPVPIPNRLVPGEGIASLDDWLAAVSPSAVVLSGGNDLGEVPERDRLEWALLDWAEGREIPVLGICRGMQSLGARSGGKLVEVPGHIRTNHDLSAPDAWPGQVNSYHAWSFVDAPPGYDVLAKSSDGVIEAMRHHRLPWEGWMWHPEREMPFRKADTERLLRLMSRG